jgi:saccharopine dehydrogenase (NADP+, L-glutamate forming)
MALFTDEAESERIIAGIKWIRILSSEKATIVEDNLLDTLCARLEKLMSFGSGERDLVRLQHKFVVEWSDGNPVFGTHIFTVFALANCTCRKPSHLPLSSSGDPDRYSGMALSVGVTCGIATQLLLDEHPALNKPGVLAPYTKDICDPIRDLLEKEGVVMFEQQAA